jgi:succinate dehydrogenase / fumarate reductase flavoprotein subunit
MWDKCGMSRDAQGLNGAIEKIRELKDEFWQNANVTGSAGELNQELEKAGRVADFFEFAELMCMDALNRNESCGGHFREEYQTEEGEAKRDDAQYCYSAVWSPKDGGGHELTKEPLEFENVHLSTRSYK